MLIYGSYYEAQQKASDSLAVSILISPDLLKPAVSFFLIGESRGKICPVSRIRSSKRKIAKSLTWFNNISSSQCNGSTAYDDASTADDNGSTADDDASTADDNGSTAYDDGSTAHDDASTADDNGSIADDNGSTAYNNDSS